jgi:hypothetical protein
MMKKTLLVLSVIFGYACSGALAQSYCTPPPFFTGPYSGISNVKLGSLDHSTPDTDGVTYYSTESAPVLQVGSSYTMSVTTEHHLVGSGFSGNLFTHAWIDWNQDGDFEDDNEVVMKIDDQFKGTYTSTVTVPSNAKLGITRMRVYNDMPDYEGHEYPDPCGYAVYPGNALGQHGESEDYNIEVSNAATGIQQSALQAVSYQMYLNRNGQIQLSFELPTSTTVGIKVFNTLGQDVFQHSLGQLNSGTHSTQFNATTLQTNQVYVVQLQVGQETISKKWSFSH